MMKPVKILLGILLLVSACNNEMVIPSTGVVVETTATAQMTVSPESTNTLTMPANTPIFTPIPALLPTTTPLSIPTSEFGNGEVQFSLINQFGGSMQAIDVMGNRAYIGVGPRLQVIDITFPNSPKLLGQSEAFSSLIKAIDIVDNRAYVALGQGGATIMDISDPANMTTISTFGFDTRIVDLIVDQNILYGVTPDPRSVYLYDVSDASNPIQLTTGTFVRTEMSPVIIDGYLYARESSYDSNHHRINIFSYNDPPTPELEGSIPIEAHYSHFTIVDNLLYLISAGINSPNVLRMVDITDPTKSFMVGEVAIDEHRQPLGISVVNGYAYILDSKYTGTPCGYEVYIFDVSKPTNIQEVNRINEGICSNHFVTVGNQLYVAEPHQMRIFDLSNPTELIEIGRYSVPLAAGQPTRILADASNTYIFEALNQTLSIWDVSSPHAPSALAPPMPLAGGDAFGVANDLIYAPGLVGERKRFRIFSLTDLSQPELIMDELSGVYTATGEPAGYVATGTSLEVVNSEGLPLAPALNRDSEGYVGVTFTQPDQFVYVASVKALPFEPEYWQLEIYDATNPAGLELVGVMPIPISGRGRVKSIIVKDDYVYVIGGEKHLLVIDVSDKSSPQVVAELPLPSPATVSTIKGDHLYFGAFYEYDDSISGLYAVNISAPLQPYLAGFMQLAGGVQSIVQVGDLFYIASGDGGVHLLEANP